MQREIEKYELADLEKTPISKTKMKFNAAEIKDKINLLISPEKENTQKDNPNISIDLTKVAESAVMDDGIGLGDLQSLKTIKEKDVSKGKGEVTYGEQ